MAEGTSENIEVYSFSKLSTFHQCKYKYFLNYVSAEKLPKLGSGYTENGSFCHELLEMYERGECEVWELAGKYEDGFDENVLSSFPVIRGIDQGESCYNDCIDFFNNFDGLDDKYKIIGAEDEFLELIEPENMEPFQFRGFIDLALMDKSNDNLILWDWKSKKNMTRKVLKEKEVQLYLYAIRMYRKYGRYPEKLIFYSFRDSKEYPIEFSEENYHNYIKWMTDTVKEIRSCADWAKQPNQFFCNNLCDFRECCDKEVG